MPDERNNLYLYEAIELRSEYDARIKVLRSVLPEARETRDRFAFRREDEVRYRPSAGFNVDDARDELNRLSIKRRKLNVAIQKVNFDARVRAGRDEVSLSEALELRKLVNEQIGELSTQLAKSAYDRVLYKEERDIVEAPDVPYADVREQLEDKRRQFRELNRNLRAAAHEVVVDFKDEQ